MGFREWWKKLKYWQKGGILGFLLFIIYYLLFIIASSIGGFNCGFLVENKPCGVIEFFRLHFLIFSHWLVYGVYLAIITTVIGMIIDMFKRK